MSPEAKIDTILTLFRQRILDGEFGTAGRLPSLRMLAEEYSTTHETINKVVQLLQAEGILVSKGRAGIFVNMPRTRVPGVVARFDRYLAEQGFKTAEANIETPAIVSAPPAAAQRMHIEEGTPVVRRFRQQGTTAAYYRIAENFYPLALAGGAILEQMQQDVHFDVPFAIKETYGQTIEQVHEEILARLPTPQEQEWLNIVRNTPVLEIYRTNYASDHKTVIMLNHLTCVASYFIMEYDYPTSAWH